MTNFIGRRPPTQLPQNFSQLPWNSVRESVYRALKWAIANYSGVPGGWKDTTPPTVLIGGTASAGNGNTAGWVAADAVYVAGAEAPVEPILLGIASAEGTSTATVHADFKQDTITLQRQIRALVSLRVG